MCHGEGYPAHVIGKFVMESRLVVLVFIPVVGMVGKPLVEVSLIGLSQCGVAVFYPLIGIHEHIHGVCLLPIDEFCLIRAVRSVNGHGIEISSAGVHKSLDEALGERVGLTLVGFCQHVGEGGVLSEDSGAACHEGCDK